MKAQAFAYGDTVYSTDGQMAQYVAEAEDGHIVRPWIEHQDVDGAPYDYLVAPVLWNHVFTEPPVSKFNEELKSINEQIEKARADLRAAQDEHRQFLASARDRSAERSKIDALRNLDDFLDGKITHYAVFEEYSADPKIITLQEAVSSENRYDKKLRLLCLYGDNKTREIYWHLDHYSSGASSSSSANVYPARSEEEARELVRKKIAEIIANEAKCPTYQALKYVTWAEKWGVPVPTSLADCAAQMRAKAAEEKLAAARKRYEQAAEELRSLGMPLCQSHITKHP